MNSQIPESAAPFFQEYSFTLLDANQHSALVIERILAYGNRTEIRWLFNYYGKAKLIEWVKRDGARLLPKRRYNFWCILFDLVPEPKQTQNAWMY